jgi:hypothetical protein
MLIAFLRGEQRHAHDHSQGDNVEQFQAVTSRLRPQQTVDDLAFECAIHSRSAPRNSVRLFPRALLLNIGCEQYD